MKIVAQMRKTRGEIGAAVHGDNERPADRPPAYGFDRVVKPPLILGQLFARYRGQSHNDLRCSVRALLYEAETPTHLIIDLEKLFYMDCVGLHAVFAVEDGVGANVSGQAA